jgi:hypothetical protein
MPKSYSQTTRNTFNKGLLTEFSELNFPEEASVDELNCTLRKAGNRSKRLGIEFESGNQLSTDTFLEGILYGTETWYNVGEESDVEFLVVQAGSDLLFYKKNNGAFSSEPVDTSYVSGTVYKVDLNTYKTPSGSPSQSHVDVASIKGRLVVVSPQINPFYIERNTVDGTFTETLINFRVRDFSYQTDRQELTDPDVSADDNRKYDTQNCGWVGTLGAAALTAYEGANSQYPPLTHPWYSGKDGSGNFSVAEWEKVYSGNSLIVNGHFVLDLFDKDRKTASGLTNVENETISARFKTVESFAGRVFFSGVDSRIYFSRILEDFTDIGELYQVNDPTSEEISDLLDTDGGYVEITEANNIKRLHAFGSSMLVFADNGVWRISGVDGVFRATEFSVFKVTNEGLAQRKSFASGANAVPFWWSYTGIHTLQVTDDGGIVEVNISEDTIQSYWDNITGTTRSSVQAEYDASNNTVLWFYPEAGEAIEYKLNRILILDTSIGAFYPWKISDAAADSPYVVGAGFFNSRGSAQVEFNVIDEDGNQVVDGSGNNVTAFLEAGVISSSEVKLLTVDAATDKLTFSTFTDLDFLDWGSANYEAYAEAAYNFVGDLGRRKTSPYITVFMRMTETGWEASGNGYTPVRNSSLKVSAYWDFRNTISSVKQEAYRFKYPLVVDTGDLDTWTYPQDVMMTRLKLRGRGRVMRLRFEGSQGKDFNLLGWETLNESNTNY